jgi:hypothetical protein
MNELPGYVWAAVLVGAVGLPAATIVALTVGARAVRLSGRSTAIIAVVAAAVWAGWLAGSVALTDAGVYRQTPDASVPWIAVTLPVVLAALLSATRIPAVARILTDPGTPARLVWPQTFRVVGGVFLIVLALDGLPAVFAVPAGLGDIAVGVSAPFVAWRLSRGGSRSRAVWFNVLGIVDLVVAVSIGFLAGLGPTNLLDVTPSTEAVTMLPLVLIPTTAVPLAVVLHLVTLRRLRAAGRRATTRQRPQGLPMTASR